MKKAITTTAWILMVSLSIAMLNCSDEDSPVEITPGKQAILPLKVGNTWTYVDSVYLSGSQPGAYNSTMTVTGQTTVTIDTTHYDVFELMMFDSLYMESTVLYMQNDALGLWNYGVACLTDTLMAPIFYAQYPVSIGSRFGKIFLICALGNPTGMGPGEVVCTHTDTLYTTPAGTFSCIRYHEYYDMPVFGVFDIYLYMAPGVGIVGQEMYTDNGDMKKRLSSYTLY